MVSIAENNSLLENSKFTIVFAIFSELFNTDKALPYIAFLAIENSSSDNGV